MSGNILDGIVTHVSSDVASMSFARQVSKISTYSYDEQWSILFSTVMSCFEPVRCLTDMGRLICLGSFTLAYDAHRTRACPVMMIFPSSEMFEQPV